VQVSICGNEALNGTADCNLSSAVSANTNQQGTFNILMRVGKPPVPCPCVLYATSFATITTAKAPFNLGGAPNGNVGVTPASTRSVNATLRLVGGGLGSWFGGPARRTLVLSVTNTGTADLTNTPVTLTYGKGENPTTLLAQPSIGTLRAGQTIQYRLPLTFKAPALGQYRVGASFTGLDKITQVSASTSSYPWALIALGWLLLQPLLLGLYKRRPIAETGPDDPFAPLPTLNDPFPTAARVSAGEDPFADLAYGAPVAAGLVAAAGVAYNAPAGSTAVMPRPASALVPGYQPVFGVTDLRLYLDPHGIPVGTTVAPRIVLGGIVPTAPPPPAAAPAPAVTPPPPAPSAVPPPYTGPNGVNGAAPVEPI